MPIEISDDFEFLRYSFRPYHHQRLEMLSALFYGSPAVPSDMGKVVFQVHELLDIWNSAPFLGNLSPHPNRREVVPSFIEERFNEVEQVDFHRIWEFWKAKPSEEQLTLEIFYNSLESYFDTVYPAPREEVVSSFHATRMEQKDYFLPALKLLIQTEDGQFWSPVYPVAWVDNQLEAQHQVSSFATTFGGNPMRHGSVSQSAATCECGIYGSVNLEELRDYRNGNYRRVEETRAGVPRLCLIEPMEDAQVWVARKGWKTTHAFISEIIGETISWGDASSLLSMVWNRSLDLSTLRS